MYDLIVSIRDVNKNDERFFLTGRRKICPTFGEEKGIVQSKNNPQGKTRWKRENNISSHEKRGEEKGEEGYFYFNIISFLRYLFCNESNKKQIWEKCVECMSFYIHLQYLLLFSFLYDSKLNTMHISIYLHVNVRLCVFVICL